MEDAKFIIVEILFVFQMKKDRNGSFTKLIKSIW